MDDRRGTMDDVKPKILCVDDEPGNLALLEAVLAPRGYEVMGAPSGEKALQRIEEQRIDLVLLDVMMPEMNGFEVCRRIKQNERTRQIPVVMITALTSKEDRIKGIEAGAEDFLSKPFDQKEVLARIKMLLQAKDLNEKRMGEILLDLELITEKQLEEGLTLARKQNIKVGDALYSMGVIQRDPIYWGLSTQLNMNYVELFPEMMNADLIKEFSIERLEQSVCLPLYETKWEIHFAIADPTDPKIIKSVKSLRPEKVAHFHLALPEKITDILHLFKQEFHLPVSHEVDQPEDVSAHFLSVPMIEPEEVSRYENAWKGFIGRLLSMEKEEAYWVSRTVSECRLLSQREGRFVMMELYPESFYLLLKRRLEHNGLPTRWFLQERATQRQGAFVLHQMNGIDREMICIERIPQFSKEDFLQIHPEVPGLVRELGQLFDRHRRLLIGGKERRLVKQSCYSFLKAEEDSADFPPLFFIEAEVESYFPKAIQLRASQFEMVKFLDRCKKETSLFLFYEEELPETAFNEHYLSKLFSGDSQNIILFFHFPSFEMMRKTLSAHQNWRQAGFQAVFLSAYQLKLI